MQRGRLRDVAIKVLVVAGRVPVVWVRLRDAAHDLRQVGEGVTGERGGEKQRRRNFFIFNIYHEKKKMVIVLKFLN